MDTRGELPKVTHPRNIRTELKTLYKELEEKGKTRARLFNLIFFAPEGARCDYFEMVAQTVVQKSPARILFVKVGSNKVIDANVSIIESREGAVCEMLRFDVGEHQRERIPYLLLPYLISDLPTFLVWGESPDRLDELPLHFTRYCDRIIFDSESAEDLGVFCQSALNCDLSKIGDLNWARTLEWRRLFAETFASKQRQEELADSSKIVIGYNDRKSDFFRHTRVQATFLASWLRSCYRELEKCCIELKAMEHETVTPGALLACEIETHGQMHFTFTRNVKNLEEVRITVCSAEICEMPTYFRLSPLESGRSLVREISHRAENPHYIDVIKYNAGENRW